MEEKKQVKISLGTAISICIIILLIIALCGVVVYYTNKEKNVVTQTEIKEVKTSPTVEANGNNKNEENNNSSNAYVPLSIFTANKKVVDEEAFLSPDTGEKFKDDYTIYKEDWGIPIYVGKDEVEFSIYSDTVKSLKDFGIIKGNGEKYTSSNKITGFDKKVVDVEFGCYGQTLEGAYIVFLMEDGTLEYTTVFNLAKNSSVEGKVKNVSNIQRLHRCATYGYNVVALDNENNLYDLTALIFE